MRMDVDVVRLERVTLKRNATFRLAARSSYCTHEFFNDPGTTCAIVIFTRNLCFKRATPSPLLDMAFHGYTFPRFPRLIEIDRILEDVSWTRFEVQLRSSNLFRGNLPFGLIVLISFFLGEGGIFSKFYACRMNF